LFLVRIVGNVVVDIFVCGLAPIHLLPELDAGEGNALPPLLKPKVERLPPRGLLGIMLRLDLDQ
jgi:hypothetical protein